MNEKLERLKDIKTENFIWVIYIGIILLSWYANSKEKKAILYDDEVSRKEYQKLMILIFSILVVIYYSFAKDSYDDMQELSSCDSLRKKNLTKASFLGSFLVLLSGLIFLGIAILDENIDVEIAFN